MVNVDPTNSTRVWCPPPPPPAGKPGALSIERTPLSNVHGRTTVLCPGTHGSSSAQALVENERLIATTIATTAKAPDFVLRRISLLLWPLPAYSRISAPAIVYQSCSFASPNFHPSPLLPNGRPRKWLAL